MGLTVDDCAEEVPNQSGEEMEGLVGLDRSRTSTPTPTPAQSALANPTRTPAPAPITPTEGNKRLEVGSPRLVRHGRTELRPVPVGFVEAFVAGVDPGGGCGSRAQGRGEGCRNANRGRIEGKVVDGGDVGRCRGVGEEACGEAPRSRCHGDGADAGGVLGFPGLGGSGEADGREGEGNTEGKAGGERVSTAAVTPLSQADFRRIGRSGKPEWKLTGMGPIKNTIIWEECAIVFARAVGVPQINSAVFFCLIITRMRPI